MGPGAARPLRASVASAGPGEQDSDITRYSPNLISIAKDALMTRYYLLPYLYTLFAQAHTAGTPVVRALFYDAPKDKIARDLETQFLWYLLSLCRTPFVCSGLSCPRTSVRRRFLLTHSSSLKVTDKPFSGYRPRNRNRRPRARSSWDVLWCREVDRG